jgi:hypothetical protein
MSNHVIQHVRFQIFLGLGIILHLCHSENVYCEWNMDMCAILEEVAGKDLVEKLRVCTALWCDIGQCSYLFVLR